MPTAAISEAAASSRALLCLECGKCTANCPLALHSGNGYSPRRMLGQALAGDHDALMADDGIWSCLGCGMCETRCPSDVHFPELLRQVRAEALPRRASSPVCTHGGTLQSLMRLMATPELRQNRLDWLTDDLRVAEQGEVLLFVGCLPYFDAYFDDLDLDLPEIARSAIRLLNRAGIEPVLLADERCCGHDLLWAGEEDKYRELVQANVEAFEASGARTIVTACAECYRTLRLDYPKAAGNQPWQVRHVSELLAEAVDAGDIQMGALEGTVTYHDPCRLGRHSAVYDEPRRVLQSIPELELREMSHSRERADCCGTSAWINCDLTSKKMQASRLASARATGAETLVTCCPKCAIHLRCALKDRGLAESAGIQIRDLTVVAANAMKEEEHGRP